MREEMACRHAWQVRGDEVDGKSMVAARRAAAASGWPRRRGSMWGMRVRVVRE